MNEDVLQMAIDGFPREARPSLETLPERGGILPADAAAELSRLLGCDLAALMTRLLPVAAAFATAPVSDYCVGAVAAGRPLGPDRANLYLGANLEIADEALSLTVHAEQSATLNAWIAGEWGLSRLAASAAPCGHCRQFLMELGSPESLDVLFPAPGGTGFSTTSLTTLLPSAFGPDALGVTATLMGAEVGIPDLALPSGVDDDLASHALQATNQSYAPYTKTFAGCALLTSDGRIVTGRCAENAAYNPSVSPLQVALSNLNMSSARGTEPRIARLVLVERKTTVTYRPETERLLANLAPDATFVYYEAT